MEDVTIVQQGWLTKRGHFIRSWRRRWFVLRDDGTLAYYKTNDVSDATAPQGEILLNGAQVLTADSMRTTCFQVCRPQQPVYYIQAASQDEKDSWIHSIAEVIEQGSGDRAVAVCYMSAHDAEAQLDPVPAIDTDVAGLGDDWVDVVPEESAPAIGLRLSGHDSATEHPPNPIFDVARTGSSSSAMGGASPAGASLYAADAKARRLVQRQQRISRLEAVARRAPKAQFCKERVELMWERLYGAQMEHERGLGLDDDDDDDDAMALDDGTIGEFGMDMLTSDIGVDPDDARMFVFFYHLGVVSMDCMSRSEFVQGLTKLEVDDMAKLKAVFADRFQRELRDNTVMRPLWKYVFHYVLEPGVRCMPIESVVPLLEVLVPHLALTQSMRTFLREEATAKVVSLDQWQQLLRFLQTMPPDCATYDEDDAWPLLLDDFVYWLREQQQQA